MRKPEVYTPALAARALQMKQAQIDLLCREGHLPFQTRTNGLTRLIRREDLIELGKRLKQPIDDLLEDSFHSVAVLSQDQALRSELQNHLAVDENRNVAALDNAFEAGTRMYELQPDCFVLDLQMGRTVLEIARVLNQPENQHMLVLGVADGDKVSVEALNDTRIEKIFPRNALHDLVHRIRLQADPFLGLTE